MCNFISLLSVVIISVLTLQSTIAQQQFSTYQLPTPQNLSSSFSASSRMIYYGAVPPNGGINQPVLVYVHGFTSLADTWLDVNKAIYSNTYNNNYRSAFISTTRGQGMWTNGDIFADMLDEITRHYGVNDVVIVAHSNGGKTSEVAMVLHNKKDKINRVITLGTPFFGTELANLAQIFAFRWVANLVGLGGGTSTSTTYYMGGTARPFLDNHANNQPNKFINFGAWGYNNGSNLGRRIAMTTSGNLLNWMGSGASTGGNDGVTPYRSSTRPNGNPQWPGHGDPNSRYDHSDITYSSFVWNDIQPLFTAPLASLRRPIPSPIEELLTSSIQLLSSKDNNMTFTVEKGKATSIIALHEVANTNFELIKLTAQGARIPYPLDLASAQHAEGYINGFATSIDLPRLEEGNYRLVSNNKFAAIVNQENGVMLEFSNQHQYVYNNQKAFRVNLRQANEYDLTQATVKAIITQVNDLEGNVLETPRITIESFKLYEDGSFYMDAPKGITKGVYNMVVSVQHPNFQRSLVTGFVVNEADNQPKEVPSEMHTTSLKTFPNPAVDVIQVAFETQQKNALLNLYDVNGRLLHQQNIADQGQQQLSLDLNALRLNQGTYFIELVEGKQKSTQLVHKTH